MLVLINGCKLQATDTTNRLLRTTIIFLGFILFFFTSARGQVVGSFEEFTSNTQDERSKDILQLYQQIDPVATIDPRGQFVDNLPNFISKVLKVDGRQQQMIATVYPKLSAVRLLVVKAASRNQLPKDLFDKMPSLVYVVVEYDPDEVTLSANDLKNQFNSEDLEDRVLLVRKIGKDK
ncbi:hypothetical protein SAMN05660862_2307 [Sphingobacterium psychroaquaticum]|uniref:DUF4252 domain-containing protein n=2 Tax=Sphingobacterium psychroaquaticum TaxID=561061 RepID=A0A1X7JXI8_9SPHI|nr:hypothetical protein SAMN05660862_2307 [Sphingobacterium psychroaquaticum]